VESYRERERQHKRTLLSLADELATTREQLARSERELATLKDECEERTLRSVAAEKEIIALRNRLQRQRGRLEGNSRTAGASKTRFEEDIEALLARSASNTRFEEDIEALLAKFERVETLGDPVRKTLDWPSPVISAHVPRYPCARVDLPDFLKGDRPRAAENMEGTR
jgi:DNA repair exonuclease SbcCD ATPase subunit